MKRLQELYGVSRAYYRFATIREFTFNFVNTWAVPTVIQSESLFPEGADRTGSILISAPVRH
jgi:hypothetical protein